MTLDAGPFIRSFLLVIALSPSRWAIAAPVVADPTVPRPSQKKVLLIGTDGTRADIMEGANTPNIHALIATGAYSNTAQTRVPTVSGPGWSSMLTGVWPDKHGVTDNKFGGKNYEKYPDFLTRLEQINPRFSTFAAADWPPLLSTESNGPIISDTIDVKFAFKAPHEPEYREFDSRIADAASTYLAKANVDAAFVYFGDVDEVGHLFGPPSPQYREAIENTDRYIGQVISAVRSRPTYAQEDWLILISTDHGQVDGGAHGGASREETTIFFLANGPSVTPQKLTVPITMVDITATALAHLEVPVYPHWGLDGKAVVLKAR